MNMADSEAKVIFCCMFAFFLKTVCKKKKKATFSFSIQVSLPPRAVKAAELYSITVAGSEFGPLIC